MIFVTMLCYSQNKETVTIETTGASISGQVDVQNEFYGQYRGVFIKTGLSPRISLLAGLNHSRISNNDFLEFPLLFQYQATPKLKVFAGPQLGVTRDRNTGEFKQGGVSFTVGATYNFTENWDASIQFMNPTIQKKGFDAQAPMLSSPIRMRTGFKF
jgi:hypothetical protein